MSNQPFLRKAIFGCQDSGLGANRFRTTFGCPGPGCSAAARLVVDAAPYWSRVDGDYAFHGGYWAAEVGFYGEVDYG